MNATPYDKCCCVRCGPPWRDTPRPDRNTDRLGWVAWGLWTALCPRCGSKRCVGAMSHEVECS